MATTTRARTIPILPSRNYLKRMAAGLREFEEIAWDRSPAFAASPRAVLVHRVRHVSTLIFSDRAHHHVYYLCGNGCNVDADQIDDILVADPPDARLLCDACEDRALRKKLPSGDQLAGRHVHRGVLVPRQVCCGSTDE